MAEYIVKTDKPIRLDEVLHLHGIHHYAVKRLGKHGRLIDADALCNKLESPDFAYFSVARFESIIAEAETIVEATE